MSVTIHLLWSQSRIPGTQKQLNSVPGPCSLLLYLLCHFGSLPGPLEAGVKPPDFTSMKSTQASTDTSLKICINLMSCAEVLD